MSEPDSVSSDVLGLKIERISQSLKRKFQTSQGKNCVSNIYLVLEMVFLLVSFSYCFVSLKEKNAKF